ncbi:MAG TPA: D-glycero-beta-D-manno-heptose-7-phosphate kinase [Longimicrobiaceae bacterium]|nr:D-glycero-beta-D-manno-heptose-7-phosphate kinase [Longimicrobiaceae bacterium]
MQPLNRDRLEEILDRAAAVRVAVVGDLMLDVYLSGLVTRISPEAPVPVVHVQEERTALGGAANVAANVARLGARCDVIGFVGRDPGGAVIREALRLLDGGDVRPLLVERGDRPTTTKTRVMARRQQVVRFDWEHSDDLPDDCAAEICARIEESVAEADVVVCEDYNKGVLTPRVIRTALAAAEARGLPVVVDPKFRHVFEYRGATVLKPNAFEIGAALGTSARAHEDEWLEEARERFGCEHLLVTLGEEGMALRTADGTTFRVPTVAREVYDVSGAGDTVTACLAVALAAGAEIREAAVLANYAAGIEVGKPGVATVSPDELRAAFPADPRTSGPGEREES